MAGRAVAMLPRNVTDHSSHTPRAATPTGAARRLPRLLLRVHPRLGAARDGDAQAVQPHLRRARLPRGRPGVPQAGARRRDALVHRAHGDRRRRDGDLCSLDAHDAVVRAARLLFPSRERPHGAPPADGRRRRRPLARRFAERGFKNVPLEELPERRQKLYQPERNSKVYLKGLEQGGRGVDAEELFWAQDAGESYN